MSDRTKAQLLAENKRLRAAVERLDRIINPPPERSDEPAPKPRVFGRALNDVEKADRDNSASFHRVGPLLESPDLRRVVRRPRRARR
jgi:hypothetical protein